MHHAHPLNRARAAKGLFKMRKLTAFFLALALLLGVVAPAKFAAQNNTATERLVLLSEYHYPGSLLTALLTEARPLTEVRARLYDQQGEVSVSTRGFTLQLNPTRRVWVALLGIHSYAEAGNMQLEIEERGIFYRNTHNYTIQISDKTFAQERIALNRALSQIRAAPDPRKEQESRALFEILTTTNPSAFYHSASLMPPTSSQRITSGYGDRRVFEYADGNEGYGIHFGIDYGGATGTIVEASASGRVALATSRIITGNSVVIEHLPGLYTSYYHLDIIGVKVGQIVQRGQIIGSLGSTGISTGPHLHWELRVAGAAIDPSAFFSMPLLDKDRIAALLSK